jgi:hypothetical protein
MLKPDFAEPLWDSEDTRKSWLRCVSVASGIDIDLAASEAQIALETFEKDDVYLLLELFLMMPKSDERSLDLEQLYPNHMANLWDTLVADSDWIAESAIRLLWTSRIPEVDRQIPEYIGEVPARRRFVLAVLCCQIDEEPYEKIREFFESNDPALRRAAARVLKSDFTDLRFAELRARALLDDDLSVRLAAGADVQAKSGTTEQYWSCVWCVHTNPMNAEDCEHCQEGTKPTPGQDPVDAN